MDRFRDLIRTLKRLDLLRTLPTVAPRPPRPRPPRPRFLNAVPDRPRARLPRLEHALRRRGEIRWHAQCRACGVSWTGRVSNPRQPAAVLATLAVLRVPCPVCWSLAWVSADQATRAAWSVVPSWLVPRWR